MSSGVFRSCDQLKNVFVYNANLPYYTILQSGQIIDNEPFEICSEDLVLYGYLNSTTEEYANKHGFIFKDISTYSTDIEISSINLNKTSITLNIGENETIIATILPEDATNKTVTWSSDNENVAKVDEGKITAISEGTAIITAKTLEGENVAQCKVIVTKAADKPNEQEKDSTTVPTEIPNAGESTTLIGLISFSILLILVFKKILKNYREIN